MGALRLLGFAVASFWLTAGTTPAQAAATVPVPAASASLTLPSAPALVPVPPDPAEWRVSADQVQLLVPLAADSTFDALASDEGWTLRVHAGSPPPGLEGFADPVVGSATLSVLPEGGYSLTLPWRYTCPADVALEPSGRLVATLKKVFSLRDTRELAPGVTYERLRRADGESPLVAHVLRVDPTRPGVAVRPVVAQDAFAARETVSSMAPRVGALAAINGSYFSTRTGEPLGLLMVDGELVSAPLFHRSAVALGRGRPVIGATSLGMRLSLPSGESYDLDGLNQARGLNRLVLYTPRFGTRTGSAPGGREWVLGADGTVLEVREADSEIPPRGRVLSGHGQAAEWLGRRLAVGMRVDLRAPLADLWPDARHVVGGGPLLLERGAVRITSEREQFRSDITWGRAPRTALGVEPSGRLLLLAVDGRQPRHSLGLTLDGLARLMRELGAFEALNLDGGGSTVMTLGDVPVSRPSEGSERPVNNALVITVDPAGQLGAGPGRP